MRRWWDEAQALAAQPNVARRVVDARGWSAAIADLGAGRAELLSLWGARRAGGGLVVRSAFVLDVGILVLELPLAGEPPVYPAADGFFPAAERMQRAVRDLTGARADRMDERPWLRHGAWPATFHPLADPEASPPPPPTKSEPYPFVRVQGEGVHEIPVGPVHAGTIEPGHFRFSVVGEKVLRLEERLGYTHKGIERRFTELALLEGHRLAARVSGDSAAAYSWAYARALESMAGLEPPPRALNLRALALELERIANHLGDLGALGNDAGFAFGLQQFSRLKELLLRAVDHAFGQRYLMDTIVPGGVRADVTPAALSALAACLERISSEAQELRDIYDEHGGLRDRFIDAGRVTPELALRLGLVGLAARASGQARDLRVDLPWAPYTRFAPAKVVRSEGDVAARVTVRFEELQESCRLCQRLLESMPEGATRSECPVPGEGALGLGVIEGWRGPVLVALEAGAGGRIHACHAHDPSWQNWPVLEHAVIDNIVPDFPLINKSFNLAYSGHDL